MFAMNIILENGKHPVLMVEVASDKSSQRDRIKKRREHFDIPSLWYYLVADQDEMLVELHIRRAFSVPCRRAALECKTTLASASPAIP